MRALTGGCWESSLTAPGPASRRKSGDDIVPGMVAAIQTHGQLLHWHPHLHLLLTCGAFTPTGDFLELPQLDLQRLETAWQESVFALYLAEEMIEPEVVENIRTWDHSGFSVDQSVLLAAGSAIRVRYQLCAAPFGPFRQLVPDPNGTVESWPARSLVCGRNEDFCKLVSVRVRVALFASSWRECCPPWLHKATYELIPETLELREIRYNIVEKGRRTKTMTVVTTLTDADQSIQAGHGGRVHTITWSNLPRRFPRRKSVCRL